MFHTFRVQNPNLSTFTKVEQRQILNFQKFINQKPDGFCCVCLKVLYPEEQKYRKFDPEFAILCLKWKMEPIVDSDNQEEKMVCKDYTKSLEFFKEFEYPGKY